MIEDFLFQDIGSLTDTDDVDSINPASINTASEYSDSDSDSVYMDSYLLKDSVPTDSSVNEAITSLNKVFNSFNTTSSLPPTPSMYGESRKQWSVEKVVKGSKDGKRSLLVGDWKQTLPAIIPVGQTYELLIKSGLLAIVEALLIDHGLIDLNAIAHEGMTSHFPEFLLQEISTRMQGGNIERRLKDVRAYIIQDLKAAAAGEKVLVIPNSITLDEMQHCEVLVDEILVKLTSNHKPKREDLLSVLYFLVIKSKHQRIFNMTQDYAVRRLDWIAEDTPRGSKEAKAARDRFLRRMSWIWEDASNCQLPLIRRLERGFHITGGANAPSTYEMLWENWGGPFTRLTKSLYFAV